jgi:thiamine-monophosphate kinase
MMRQTVRDIGEFGLIRELRSVLPEKAVWNERLRAGIGDDTAVFIPVVDESLLVTTDALVEGIHFRLDWTDWRSLGHKALAVNLSDIAAMGGTPKLATVTLGLKGSEAVDDLRKLYRGMGALAAKHGVVIAGGDIVRSPETMSIDITLIGNTRLHGRWLPRTTAKPGDLICVTGTLGASAAGLQLLTLHRDDPRRNAKTADHLIAAHLRPEPRVAAGRLLLQHQAHAAMDLSDGLFGDLPKILAGSGVAAHLDAPKIPVAAAVRALFPEEWFDFATRGGEDYELLFTIAPATEPGLREELARIDVTMTVIGETVSWQPGEPLMTMTDLAGREVEVPSGAFDHF